MVFDCFFSGDANAQPGVGLAFERRDWISAPSACSVMPCWGGG